MAVSIVTSRQNLVATREIARQEHPRRHQGDSRAGSRRLYNLQLAKMAAYQRIHELLVDPKAAAGRRTPVPSRKGTEIPCARRGWLGRDQLFPSPFARTRSGRYTYRGQVDEDVVLDAWHHRLVNIAGPVREFMAHRQAQKVEQPWAQSHGPGFLKRSSINAAARQTRRLIRRLETCSAVGT